jgi:ankyrin repeat protein
MSLTTLPPETLLSIAQHLTCKGLWSLVSTCQRLWMLVALRGEFYSRISLAKAKFKFPYCLVRAAILNLYDPFAWLLHYVEDINKVDIDVGLFPALKVLPRFSTAVTSIIHVVSQTGDDRFIKLVLKAGASPSLVDRRELTPLYLAAWHGRAAAAQLLISAGADVNSSLGDPSRKKLPAPPTPLHGAIESDNMAMAELLLEAGADPTLIVPHTSFSHLRPSPLSFAAGHGSLEMLQRLIRAARDRSSPTWQSAVDSAAKRLDPSFIEVLLEAGALYDDLALVEAVRDDRAANVRALLCARDQFRPRGARRGSVLNEARSLQVVDVIMKMAPEMATPTAIFKLWSSWYTIPPQCVDQHTLILPRILEICAGLEDRDDILVPLLHRATLWGYVPAMQMVLAKYPSLVNSRDKDGKTPLLIADQLHPDLRMDCVRLLVDDFECDLNAQDNKGRSALHFTGDYDNCSTPRTPISPYAFDLCHAKVAKYLAGKGATLDLRDGEGRTPVEYILSQTRLSLCAATVIELWRDLSSIEQPLRTLGLPAFQKCRFTCWKVCCPMQPSLCNPTTSPQTPCSTRQWKPP